MPVRNSGVVVERNINIDKFPGDALLTILIRALVLILILVLNFFVVLLCFIPFHSYLIIQCQCSCVHFSGDVLLLLLLLGCLEWSMQHIL